MRLWTSHESITVDQDLGLVGSVAHRAARLEAEGLSVLRWGTVDQPEPGWVLAEFALAGEPLPVPEWYGDQAMVALSPAADSQAVAIVIPTGVGARIGGFIADAGPFVRVVESLAHRVILHPNVVNGGDFYAGSQRSLYVDGYTLDTFFAGRVRLASAPPRRIGLVIEADSRTHVTRLVNAANGVRAVHGIDMVGYAVCEAPLGASVARSASGHYCGVVQDARPLLVAADQVRAAGADAIAIVTTCGGADVTDWEEHYLHGGVNPVGALEALLSRLVTRVTGVPSAHAPLYVGALGEYDGVVDPRVAGEVASGTGLPCVLLGLSRAPAAVASGGVGVADLAGIVIPYGCAAGAPAHGAQRYDVPLIAVRANACTVGVAASALDRGRVVEVASPAEAVAYLAASSAGVAWDLLCAPPTSIKEVPPTEGTRRKSPVSAALAAGG
jgi:hypothetical protein